MKHKLSTKCVILISVISSVVVLAILFAIVYKIDQYKKEEPLLSKEEYIGSTWHLDGFKMDFMVYPPQEGYSDGYHSAIAVGKIRIGNTLCLVELQGVTPDSHTFVISLNPSENPIICRDLFGVCDDAYITLAIGHFAKKDNRLFVLTIDSVAEDFPES